MRQRILKSMPMYDRYLGARVYPWTHPIHSWVGYIYIFDDESKDDLLYYICPADGQMIWYVHVTRAEMTPGHPFGYALATNPDPEVDKQIRRVVVFGPD